MFAQTPAVRITAKREGFRRAGMAHSATSVVHPPGTFTYEQLEVLAREPMLVVQVAEDDAEDDAEDGDLDQAVPVAQAPIKDPQPAPAPAGEDLPADPKAPAKGGKAGAKAGTKDPEPPKGGDGQ